MSSRYGEFNSVRAAAVPTILFFFSFSNVLKINNDSFAFGRILRRRLSFLNP